MSPKKTAGPGSLVDAMVLGRRLRAARVLAPGYESMSALTSRIRELGVSTSDRTLYALERGEQLPSYELMVALALVLEPPGGARFFWAAIDPKHAKHYAVLTQESEDDALDRTASRQYIDAQAEHLG